MTLLINGGAHAAAAHAVVPYAEAREEPALFYLGAAPHPANAVVGWPRTLGRLVKMIVHNESQAENTNWDIAASTRRWLLTHPESARSVRVIIQWEHWCHQHEDEVAAQSQTHDMIWNLHVEFIHQQIPHLFFNSEQHFTQQPDPTDWGHHYLGPYQAHMTYSAWLKTHGHDPVSPNLGYFGAKAHSAWARFVLQYGIQTGFWG